MRISIITLGCRTNQAESCKIEQAVQKCGHEIVKPSGDPDVCIINTCSVTSKADAESRRIISRYLKSGARVIVTGCYAELKRDEIAQIGGNSLEIVQNSRKDDISDMLQPSHSAGRGVTVSRMRPIIKVQDGCDNHCSYCIVPRARGRSKSANINNILEDIARMQLLGLEEIVLSGIHLGAYGKDFSPKASLSFLLKSILEKTTIARIRLSSLEVTEFDDELIEILDSERICRHLHIPLQSGSDRVLRRMNRNYSRKQFESTLLKVLGKRGSLAIGTDIIVGFPAESDEDFEMTYSLVEEMPFSYLHIFPFSVRSGTPAASMPEKVPSGSIRDRSERLHDLGEKKRNAFIHGNIGASHVISVESVHPHGYIGTTSNYIKVTVEGKSEKRPGMLAEIRITGQEGLKVLGTPLYR